MSKGILLPDGQGGFKAKTDVELTLERINPSDGDIYLVRVSSDKKEILDRATQMWEYVCSVIKNTKGFRVSAIILGAGEDQDFELSTLDVAAMNQIGWVKASKTVNMLITQVERVVTFIKETSISPKKRSIIRDLTEILECVKQETGYEQVRKSCQLRRVEGDELGQGDPESQPDDIDTSVSDCSECASSESLRE